MKHGAWLLTIVAACGGRAAPVAKPPIAAAELRVVGAPADGVRDGEGRVRPEATAGLYWQAYVTCDECATPAAVVAYVAPDAQAARTIIDAIGDRLGLGLPYVLHTDELTARAGDYDLDEELANGDDGADGDDAAEGDDRDGAAADEDERAASGGGRPRRIGGGVAVITGTFASREAAAAAARGSDAIAGVTPTVIDVGANGDFWSENPRHVTAIDRGPPTPAWTAADVDEVEAALGALEGNELPPTLEAQRAWTRRELYRRKPACTVRPGDLFVVDDAELRWYDLAPVRCGGQRAYVEWTRSLLGHAVVVDDGRGGHRLFQVVGAECDSPIIREWRYDDKGRHPLAPATDDDGGAGAGPQLALGGC